MRSSKNPSAVRRQLERLDAHPGLNVGSKAATIVSAALAMGALIVAVLNLFWTARSGEEETPGSHPTDVSHSDSATASTERPVKGGADSAGGPSLSPGVCLDDQGNPRDCALPYVAQIYAHPPCDYSQMVAFLGGNPDVEVLLPEVAPEQVEIHGHAYCVVPTSLPGGSMANALQHNSGDRLRHCRDERTRETVPCSGEHTAEYVYIAQGANTAIAETFCEDRAGDYLDVAYSLHAARLTLTVESNEGSAACLISVRGGGVLTDSVRNISHRSLPIRTGS